MVERVIGKIGSERGSETATENERGRKGIGQRGIKTERGRENERETGRESVNGNVTGIVMEVEIVGTGIEGMRGTGRNVLQLESLPGSRGSLVGSPQGNSLLPSLRRPLRRLPDLQMAHPGIGRLPRVKTDWVNDADLLTMTPIVPPNEPLVRIVRTTRSGPAEVVVGMAEASKV